MRIDTKKTVEVLSNMFVLPYPPRSGADVAQIAIFVATIKFAFPALVAYAAIFSVAAAVRFDKEPGKHGHT
jgi:hypothetical protein